ncbi:stage 0 sporulation family protein [Geomonas sp. Red32]|uniref:PSP1 domain-containing protein n=1 Tax=Geomonas sp. Red32 TaxID=2912856 RepID=UPI00202CB9C0|nr:stage 0 sporulation family protein [Geomonas sp. Red32]MCM0084339.1 stage 0 sporulation family protein [Geomonas sp. Red32]
MAKIARIQFTAAGKLYDFLIGKFQVKPGDRVIVETERGKSIGHVVAGPIEIDDSLLPEGAKTLQRMAEAADFAALATNAAKEKEAHKFCLTRIKERGMDMKLVKVEYLFDGSKAIFYFTADGRVDFRELVKDLAHAFHTRIEMRQIGVRDESKMVGGIGICGRELCCSSYLREFEPVSVKMAKEQNLALNPSKISGQCGRLLCCLSYEFDTYCSLRKGLPKCGKRVQCGHVDGEVVKVNVLQGTVTLKTTDDSMVILNGDEITPDQVSDKVKKPQPGKGEGQGQQDKGKAAQAAKQQRRDRRPQDVKERKKEKPS